MKSSGHIHTHDNEKLGKLTKAEREKENVRKNHTDILEVKDAISKI